MPNRKILTPEIALEIYCKQVKFKWWFFLPLCLCAIAEDIQQAVLIVLVWLLLLIRPLRNRLQLRKVAASDLIIQEDRLLKVHSDSDGSYEYTFEKLGFHTDHSVRFVNVSPFFEDIPVYVVTAEGMSLPLIFDAGSWRLDVPSEEEILASADKRLEKRAQRVVEVLEKNPIPKLYGREGLDIDPGDTVSRVPQDKPYEQLTPAEQVAVDHFSGDLVPVMEYACRVDEISQALLLMEPTEQERQLFSLVKKQVKKADRAAKKAK